jgi:hypothetical protein
MALTIPATGVLGDHHHAITVTESGTQNVAATFALAGAWPTSDLAIYVPVRVKRRVVVVKLHVGTGSASGNLDVGVYNESGTRLVSSGTTAQASSGQTVDVTDTTIGPGLYYLALVADNTTGTFNRMAPAAPICVGQGLLSQQLGAGGTLPTTATWAIDQTLAYSPFVAMLLDPTVA